MNASVPDTFPRLPAGDGVPGTQLKFNVSRDTDGIFRQPGGTLAERANDYAQCSNVVDWAVALLAAKLVKPRYAGLTKEEALLKLESNLIDCFDMPDVYRAWVLSQVAARTDWRLRRP